MRLCEGREALRKELGNEINRKKVEAKASIFLFVATDGLIWRLCVCKWENVRAVPKSVLLGRYVAFWAMCAYMRHCEYSKKVIGFCS